MAATQVSEGVLKEVIKEADAGAQDVSAGDKITVHCTGSLSGNPPTKFWSTKDEGQKPFSFQVGMGRVIKGWDEGCKTMKIGEVAKFTLAAHKGYGKRGFAAWKIPPNAELIFEIELLSID